jgi:hypothetical protein|tara:strand:+ start:3140 stop:3274 length:135 start_codon:yes stop_codon:yes gene_type:complete
LKVNIELTDQDTEEVIELAQRLVIAVEKIVTRLEDIAEPLEEEC